MDDTTQQLPDEMLDIPSDITEQPQEETKIPPKKRTWIPYLILAVLFAVGLAVYLFLPSGPQSYTDPNMPWFSVCDGVLQYDASLYNGSKALTVPSTIAGQTVTSIGGACFAGDSFITTVNLPDTITVIGSSAFADCTSLRGVFIPESVTEIAPKAFRNCTSLESLCIPYTVKDIGNEAFGSCPKLIHIFYTGPHASWASLYTERISPETKIYAANGTVKQDDIVAAAKS